MHLQDRHGRVFDIGNYLCFSPSPQGNVTTIQHGCERRHPVMAVIAISCHLWHSRGGKLEGGVLWRA